VHQAQTAAAEEAAADSKAYTAMEDMLGRAAAKAWKVARDNAANLASAAAAGNSGSSQSAPGSTSSSQRSLTTAVGNRSSTDHPQDPAGRLSDDALVAAATVVAGESARASRNSETSSNGDSSAAAASSSADAAAAAAEAVVPCTPRTAATAAAQLLAAAAAATDPVEAVKLHLAALGVKDPADVSRTLMAEIGACVDRELLILSCWWRSTKRGPAIVTNLVPQLGYIHMHPFKRACMLCVQRVLAASRTPLGAILQGPSGRWCLGDSPQPGTDARAPCGTA
jgi:hypothetical protein